MAATPISLCKCVFALWHSVSFLLVRHFPYHCSYSLYSKDLFGGEYVEVVPTSTIAFQDRMVRPGTIDILVRLASVTIKCHQSFDIYPKTLVGEVEPLIQFHTTTTESISLQEVRAEDDVKGESTPDDRTDNGDETGTSSLMVVREQQTDRTGYRVISIRPAMYEKIETWNTPS